MGGKNIVHSINSLESGATWTQAISQTCLNMKQEKLM